MLATIRTAATGLLAACVVLGWPILIAAGAGYLGVAVPALLAAWSAAWFGDEMEDLINLGPDGLIRSFGLGVLLIMAVVAAATRWQWFR